MKLFLVICLCSVLSVAVLAAETVYTNYDEVNVESMIMDDKKMKVIFDCIFDRAPCGDYQKLKDEIAQMVPTDCSECSPKQRAKYNLAKLMVAERYPKELEQVIKKYALKSE
ncbi:ejaculatory bulb-specific protein 3-like isoform X3 [Choristoneura fumiferana]|uniref:ejaculatory bulb-specific protein 3-like isoform X3 n=1 Tax=Choristoneura fumiferana TaxID=7141 RepID=UPI003D15B463